MAVTKKPNLELGDGGLNSSSNGTSNKGQSNFSYDEFSYNPYQESQTVSDAKTALNTHLTNNQPSPYTSQWQTQINDAMGAYMNRDKFSYDLNGDALYQQYKDKYIQQGKMASADVMGQAAAMTGGYGNSYAASVGNQAYQASLQNLNDIIPQLHQAAYDRYMQEGQDLLNNYGLLLDRENTDYGRYRDTVSDFNTERDYLTGRYDSERAYDYGIYSDNRNFDYGKYADDKSYAYNEYRNAIADKQWQTQMDFQAAQVGATKNQSGVYKVPAKAPSLSASEYNDVLANAADYADQGETALANYLNGLVARGLSKDEAAAIYEQYFPEDLPGAKPEPEPKPKPGTKEWWHGTMVDMMN